MRDLFTYKLSYLSFHIRLCKRQAAYITSERLKSVTLERIRRRIICQSTSMFGIRTYFTYATMLYLYEGSNQKINVLTRKDTLGLHQERTFSDNFENVCTESKTGTRPNEVSLRANIQTTLFCNTLKFSRQAWKNISLGHVRTYKDVSQYVSDDSDKLLFNKLNEKRQQIKQKYSFNEYSSSTHVRSYNFNRSIKKINLTSLYKILKSFFLSLSSLISKPRVDVYPDMLRIRLFYYVLPSIKKMIRMKILHTYIRLGGAADMLRKEKIKRRNFKIIMNKFKITLFIAKWKEANSFIRMARPLTERLRFSIKDFKIETQPEQQNAYQCSSISLEDVLQFRRVHKKKNLFYTTGTKETLIEDSMHTSLEDKSIEMGLGVSAHTLLDDNKERSSFLELKLSKEKEGTLVSLNKLKFKYLLFLLEKLLKKTIILEVVRLKYPYHESTILAQILGKSSTSKNFRILMRNLLYTTIVKNPTKMIRKQNFSIIPSYLSGLKVKLAGRLRTQKVVPRFTVQSFQIGSLGRGKTNLTTSSRITLKNKRGAFSFTVSTSHIFET